MIKYSFVLPAYKARFFKEALDSILNQTYKEFELIIVNDASPEDLDSIVNSYDDPRIRYYVNEKNIGGKDLVAQWNHCLDYATGEYIILASDDDVYHLEYLEKMDVLVQKYPDVNVFRPRVQRIDKNGKIFEIESIIPEFTSQLEFSYLRAQHYVKSAIGLYIFRKDKLFSNGGFENYPMAWHADDATVAIMARNGMVSCPDILYSFRESGESITSKLNNSYILRRKIEATFKYCDYQENLINTIDVKNNDEYELFYKHAILQDLPYYKKQRFYQWICESETSAIWKNFLFLIKEKTISIKALMFLLFRRLFIRTKTF